MSVKFDKAVNDCVDSSVRHEDNGFRNSNSEFLVNNLQKSHVDEEKNVMLENGKENEGIVKLKDDKLVAGLGDSSGNGDGEGLLNGFEVKEQQEVKLDERVFTLNAKIKEETDSALSATAGWQAVRTAGNEAVSSNGSGVNQSLNNEDKSDFELNSDGSLPFYILDAHE